MIRVLREPVERAFSWYRHGYEVCRRHHKFMKRFTNDTLQTWGCNIHSLSNSHYDDTFHDYLVENRIPIEDNFYAEQIQRWLQVIQRKQLLIISMQSLLRKTSVTMRCISSFLGIDPSSFPTSIESLPHANKVRAKVDRTGKKHTLGCSDCMALQRRFEAENSKLYRLMEDRRLARPACEEDFPHFENDACNTCIQ